VIQVGRLILTGGASIDSRTEGGRHGGTVAITATDSVAISGTDSEGRSRHISSFTLGNEDTGRVIIPSPALSMDEGFSTTSTGGEGRAGDLEVQVGRLMLTGGAIVEGSTFGAGRGGDIDLRARDVELSDGAIISARSTGDGAAGTLGLQVAETFRSESGHMTMAAVRAGGGTIALTAGRLVQLIDSELSTSVRVGGSDAGNLTIEAPFIISQGSQIITNAFGGRGGNIGVGGEVCLADPASQVSASSTLGLQRMVDIRAPVTNLSGAVASLPQGFMNVARLLPARCAARLGGGNVSSLVVGGQEGLPLDPSGLLPSPLVLDDRPAADVAMIGKLPWQPSTNRFALLTTDDKILPRMRLLHANSLYQTASDPACSRLLGEKKTAFKPSRSYGLD
jgi:hypothetical protein